MTNEQAITQIEALKETTDVYENFADKCEALNMAIDALKLLPLLPPDKEYYVFTKNELPVVNGIDINEAIEKQTPMEPERMYYWAFCPRCHGLLGDITTIRVSGRQPDKSKVYCNKCGQALTDEMGVRAKQMYDIDTQNGVKEQTDDNT